MGSFTIKGGASEANSAITVAAAGITVGAGTDVPTSDPVTINSNVFDLNSFGAATASAPSFEFTGNTDIESSDFTVSNSGTVTLTIAADGSITGPGGAAVQFPAGIATPSVSIDGTSITAPGGVTTPQVVRSPAAKVDFPTGVSTTDVTGSGAIQGATVTGTTSVNTPSVDITTTAITAPGGVTTPQVSVSGSPAPKIAFPTGVSTPAVTAPSGVTTPQGVRSPAAQVDFPTGVSTPSLTAPSIDGPGAQIHTQSLNNGPAANVNVILDASDRRLKRNLSGIKDSLDKVLRLKGLYF